MLADIDLFTPVMVCGMLPCISRLGRDVWVAR